VQETNNKLSCGSTSCGTRIMACVALLLLVACSDPQETAQPEPALADVPESPPEPQLDALLPEQFEMLTAPWFGDLDGMAERRIIRTLVISGGPQFFYYDGKPRGLIAELLGLFQQELNVGLNRRLDQVEIMPMPVSRDRLIPALISGQADLVAADLTITDARSELVDYSVAFSQDVDEVVVFAPGRGEGVDSLDDLSGHSIYVRAFDRA